MIRIAERVDGFEMAPNCNSIAFEIFHNTGRVIGTRAQLRQMTKMPADLRSLCRGYTEEGVRWLAGIAQHSRSDSARVSAIATLFERGWGKAQNEDGTTDGEIRVVIRHIIEGRDPPTIINTKALSKPEGEP